MSHKKVIAQDVSFNPTGTGLVSTNVQDAIEEVGNSGGVVVNEPLETTVSGDFGVGVLFDRAGFLYYTVYTNVNPSYTVSVYLSDDGINYNLVGTSHSGDTDRPNPNMIFIPKDNYVRFVYGNSGPPYANYVIHGFVPITTI